MLRGQQVSKKKKRKKKKSYQEDIIDSVGQEEAGLLLHNGDRERECHTGDSLGYLLVISCLT